MWKLEGEKCDCKPNWEILRSTAAVPNFISWNRLPSLSSGHQIVGNRFMCCSLFFLVANLVAFGFCTHHSLLFSHYPRATSCISYRPGNQTSSPSFSSASSLSGSLRDKSKAAFDARPPSGSTSFSSRVALQISFLFLFIFISYS